MTPSRRGFLEYSCLGAALVGAGVATVPFVASLGPAANAFDDQIVHVPLSDLAASPTTTVSWRQFPVTIVRRRTADLAALRRTPPDDEPRTSVFPFPVSVAAPRNWHRGVREDYLVVVAVCDHDFVRVVGPDQSQFVCPWCASRFDLAGRCIAGLGKFLPVPPHHFDAQGRLAIGAES